jgi:ribosome-associated protein
VTDVLRVGRLQVPLSELTWRFDTPGGPGGQHANRAATRAEVRFDVVASPSLTDSQRSRLSARVGPVVVAASADSRSQSRNRDLALERLRTILGEALREERPRRKTKPSRAAKTRRLDSKRKRSEVKKTRGRVHPDD